MKYDDFITRFSLAQREFPKGIGVGKTMSAKRIVYKRRSLASEKTWEIPEPYLDEIIKECEKKWSRLNGKI